MNPVLEKSYKHAYPFRIGTTSYIYPDHILPNVKMLAPYLDEIELLIFESDSKDTFLTKHGIENLLLLSEEFDLTYNIHLPLDISLSDKDPAGRIHAVETMQRLIDLAAPLSPSSYTLHLPYDDLSRKAEHIKKWQDIIYKSMERLLSFGMDGQIISIETLDYPIEWADKVINDFNLSVCIDIGHLIVNGYDIEAVFGRYGNITTVIHLHGVENMKDHLALSRMPEKKMDIIIDILKRFTGTLSLEVFSYEHLSDSLKFLEICWKRLEKGE